MLLFPYPLDGRHISDKNDTVEMHNEGEERHVKCWVGIGLGPSSSHDLVNHLPGNLSTRLKESIRAFGRKNPRKYS
jgi:hypothetical protein